MKLGLPISIDAFDEGLAKIKEFGFSTCQIGCGDGENLTESRARDLAARAREAGVEITSVWPGYPYKSPPLPAPLQWDYRRESSPTVGLVPLETQALRLEYFKRASDFARWMGCPNTAQHVGYIPEDPHTETYLPLVACMQELADYCWQNDGQWFCFETGQETPCALMRTLQDCGRPNLGINYDTANVILYGKGNPVDSLDMLGQYVREVHAKDGLYPTDGYKLGQEVPLGEGKANLPAVIARLKELGYDGAITLECELGANREQALQNARKLLESLI
jgi:L-ribulose-5-phosphate 3-epimerase